MTANSCDDSDGTEDDHSSPNHHPALGGCSAASTPGGWRSNRKVGLRCTHRIPKQQANRCRDERPKVRQRQRSVDYNGYDSARSPSQDGTVRSRTAAAPGGTPVSHHKKSERVRMKKSTKLHRQTERDKKVLSGEFSETSVKHSRSMGDDVLLPANVRLQSVPNRVVQDKPDGRTKPASGRRSYDSEVPLERIEFHRNIAVLLTAGDHYSTGFSLTDSPELFRCPTSELRENALHKYRPLNHQRSVDGGFRDHHHHHHHHRQSSASIVPGYVSHNYHHGFNSPSSPFPHKLMTNPFAHVDVGTDDYVLSENANNCPRDFLPPLASEHHSEIMHSSSGEASGGFHTDNGGTPTGGLNGPFHIQHTQSVPGFKIKNENVSVKFGKLLWIHLQAWLQDRPLDKGSILQSLEEQDRELVAKRTIAFRVFGEIKSFRLRGSRNVMEVLQEHLVTEIENILQEEERRSRSGSVSVPPKSREPTCGALTAPPSVGFNFATLKGVCKAAPIGDDGDPIRVCLDETCCGTGANLSENRAQFFVSENDNELEAPPGWFRPPLSSLSSQLSSHASLMFDEEYIGRLNEALLKVQNILDLYEELQTLYPNNAEMEREIACELTPVVSARLTVLQMWANVTRELCGKIRQIGLMLGMNRKNVVFCGWPNLELLSLPLSGGPMVFADPNRLSTTSSMNSPSTSAHGSSGNELGRAGSAGGSLAANQDSGGERKHSAAEICSPLSPSSANTVTDLYQAFVERSLKRRGMRRVLSRVGQIAGDTLEQSRRMLQSDGLPVSAGSVSSTSRTPSFRGKGRHGSGGRIRQDSGRSSGCDEICSRRESMESWNRSRKEIEAKRTVEQWLTQDQKSSSQVLKSRKDRNLRVAVPNRPSVPRSRNSSATATTPKTPVPSTPEAGLETRKLLNEWFQPRLSGTKREKELELVEFGANNPEYASMNLPSLLPAFLFLLKIPLQLVHEWLRMRAAGFSKGSEKANDPLTLQQLIQDSRDVLESAVAVKWFYHQRVMSVISDQQILEKLLFVDFTEYEDDVVRMFALFLAYVREWISVCQDSCDESGLSMFKDQWRFAKRVAIHIKDGETEAAKQFCVMGQNMLGSIADFLDNEADINAQRHNSIDLSGDEDDEDDLEGEVMGEVGVGHPAALGKASKDTSYWVSFHQRAAMLRGEHEELDETKLANGDISATETEGSSSSSAGAVDQSEPPDLAVSDPSGDSDETDPLDVEESTYTMVRPQEQYQLPRNLKLLIGDARERCTRALTFAKMLRTDLEITTSYLMHRSENDIIERLYEHSYCIIDPVSLPIDFLILVPSHIASDEPYTQLLLNVTCGRSVEESPMSKGKRGHLVLLKTEDRAQALANWKGSVKRVVPDTDTIISLTHIQVCETDSRVGGDGCMTERVISDLQLAVVHSKDLRDAQRDLGRVLDADYIEKVDQQCSCHAMIADSMLKMKLKAMDIRKKIVSWLLDVERAMSLANVHDDNTRNVYRDTVIQAYDFGFEYHRFLAPLICGNLKADLAHGFRQLSLQWISYVLTGTDVGKGTKPRWARWGYKCLIVTTDPQYAQYYSDQEWKTLKSEMSKCFDHSIGTKSPKTPVDERPRPAGPFPVAASPMVPPEIVLSSVESKQSLAGIERHAAINSKPDSKSPNSSTISDADSRVCRVRRAVEELSQRKDSQLRKQKMIGKEIESRNVNPETKIKHCRARFSWHILKKIGAGASGEVYTAMNTDANQVMAVKIIAMDKLNKNHQSLKTLVDEITNFEAVRHRNLVQYYGTEIHNDEFMIFMELCHDGNLEDAVKEGLHENIVRHYTSCLLAAVCELHRHKIIHRDIKTANIFLKSEPKSVRRILKLGDFGCSVRLNTKSQTGDIFLRDFVGTLPYMAPEIITSSYHSYPADIWSVGCVVLEMLTGKPPWHDKYPQNIMYHVGTGNAPAIPDNLSSLAKSFLKNCFEIDPEKRWQVHRLMDHSFAKVGMLDDPANYRRTNSMCNSGPNTSNSITPYFL